MNFEAIPSFCVNSFEEFSMGLRFALTDYLDHQWLILTQSIHCVSCHRVKSEGTERELPKQQDLVLERTRYV